MENVVYFIQQWRRRKLLEDVGFMFKYLNITIVRLTEERKNQRYYSSHEHEKSKKNYIKSP